jgi:hypothetical protein
MSIQRLFALVALVIMAAIANFSAEVRPDYTTGAAA